ncbi:MAG TPA: N-acetylneuraminate synthase family protein [Rhizomicrobium sp.]|nr:N-acetylneuraminate synthase family protein [Rhizomicrobium sp.]
MGKERDKFFKSLPEHLRYEPVAAVRIADRLVGRGHPVFIIAEVGANHHSKLEHALLSIEKAAEAGADAVKFQHLTHNKIAADTIVYDQWHGKEIGAFSDFYRSAELPPEWTEKLMAHARKHGILFFSTPFDLEAVALLDKAGVPAFKVASYELTDDILLRAIARTGKPVIVSTGMAYLEEVAHAVRTIQEEGNADILVLHCTSIYPPKRAEDLNLRAIKTLAHAFKLPIGYSDHSPPPFAAASVAAVALGACAIEKHFTLNRDGGSNDDPNSLSPDDLSRFVAEIRYAEGALRDSGIKQPVVTQDHAGDEINDRWARRSLYAARDLRAGEILTAEMVITLRPWGGIEPKHAGLVMGRKLAHDVKARAPLEFGDFFAR